MVGVLEQDCRDWFRDMEACGWAKVDGTPFGNWRRELTIHRDRLRERKHRESTLPNGMPRPTKSKSSVQQNLDEAEKRMKELGIA